MRITEAIKERQHTFLLHRCLERRRNFDRSRLLIFPEFDRNGIARTEADLFANAFRIGNRCCGGPYLTSEPR